ncbi:MAG TPA: hypothetical protein VFE34_10980 [Dongiaceae bacterium]|nr:hypothetical protein [Dongiaceae bacterium]
MTERDPFERELGRAMEPRPAPAELQRRIARIPLEHPRPRGERRRFSWRRWFNTGSAPWAASMTAAFASLAVGFWLGFSGLSDSADTAYASNDEALVSLVFPSVPTTLGEEQ